MKISRATASCRIERLFAFLCLPLVLASCASTPPSIPIDKSTSVVTYVREFRKLSAPFIDLDAPGRPTRYGKFDSYTYLWMSWPIAPLRGAKPSMLNGGLRDICNERGGTWLGTYCIDSSKSFPVLFMAKEGSDAGDFTIEVIEPAPGIVSEEYRQRLAQAGYQTTEESAARQAEAQRQFAEKQARIGERGTKVCRDAPPVKLVGFVEDTNQDKIKVLVSARYVAGMLSGGFSQYLTWEPKQSWRVCE